MKSNIFILFLYFIFLDQIYGQSTEITTEQQSTIDEITTEMSTIEESTAEMSTTEESTTEMSTIEESTAEMSTTEESTTEMSTIEESTTEMSTAEMETTTTTPEVCAPDLSEYLNVTDRTSTMFNALINYNCSLINISELVVIVNETIIESCSMRNDLFDNKQRINLTCVNIENYAGRNWNFTIEQRDFNEQILILNQTFSITFEPLSLDDLFENMTVEIDKNITYATISIPNCTIITELKYLKGQCYLSSNETIISDDCQFICLNIQPGSFYQSSLIRLPIPIIDQFNQTFQQQIRSIQYQTNLSPVTNISFDENSNSIQFERPRGNYDQVLFNCSTQDQTCSKTNSSIDNTIGNCSECTSISFSSITKAILYRCNITTIKPNFIDITITDFNFTTPLQPITIDNWDELKTLTNKNLIFNLTIASDYDDIESYCLVDYNIIDRNQISCLNLTSRNSDCSNRIHLNGTYGCNYQCYFFTKKRDYEDQSSKNYSVGILPLKPYLYILETRSRSIHVNWTFNETVYKKSFLFYQNGKLVANGSKSAASYTFLHLDPNKNYTFSMDLISNQIISSNLVSIKTLEDVPPIPDANEIKTKILPLDTNIYSQTEQYAIEIDLSLYSNINGNLMFYQIYVRQNQTKNTTKFDFVGTYSQAYSNQSLDYLALRIPISTTTGDKKKITILLGNETNCKSPTNSTVPCNGKLKPDKQYKLVVSGCTTPGCSSVISQSFRTHQNPAEPGSSLVWIVIFPIVLVIVVLISVWKRKNLKDYYERMNIKSRTSHKTEQTVRYSQENPTQLELTPIITSVKPKYLYQYMNLTHEDEKSIYAEYKILEDMSPTYRHSTIEQEFSIYDRYENIHARGPWNRTAIRLVGTHRVHDYVNANEINSYDGQKQYIACQGPIKTTCIDFWDMIIQYQVKIIIMLTKLEERNPHNSSIQLSKCYRYFPMNINQSIQFGRLTIRVNTLEHNQHVDLEIRHITIKDENETEHNLVHYYFTGWPDYNVVEPRKLLGLIETINHHHRPAMSHTVVHCSAGVGRTGTYIAVETVMRLLNKCSDSELNTMKLDIMGIVHQLRKDRTKMVQTKEQYLLVNRCVEEHLKRTNRLDLITKRSKIFENENRISKLSSRLSDRSTNHQNDSSPPPIVPPRQSKSSRSSTVTQE